MRLYLAAVVAVLLVAAPAQAQWAARDTGITGDALFDPALTFGTTDRGLVHVRTFAGIPMATAQTGGAFATLTRSGGSVRRAGTIEAAPARYAATRVIFARVLQAGTRRAHVGVSFGSADPPRIGAFRRLDTVNALREEPVLAANAAGDAAMAWIEQRGDRHLLWLSLRRAGGSFGRPRVIRGTGLASGLSLAVGSGRHLVVAYQHNAAGRRSIEVRHGGIGGGVTGLRAVGASKGVADTAAAVARTGRATVAWSTQDGGEEANELMEIGAAVKPAGARSFRLGVVLDRANKLERTLGSVRVAAAPDGTATVAWSLPVGDSQPVRASTQDARAAFGPVQTLGASGALGGLAAAADGRVLATWVRAPAGKPYELRDVAAAIAPSRGAFGSLEVVAPEDARSPVAAFEPVAGRLVVAWVAIQGATSRVRVAFRG